jgi:ADP-heptose:LPS heptosyltransferase
MVPIYQRSFPQLDILETRDGVAEDQIDFVAMMGNLVACFAPDENTPDPDFHPLHADLAKAADLRSQYQDGKSTPLVGIFWFSSHHGKELPDLAEWRTFINSVDAQFVSLQYGDVTEDIEALGRDRVLVDPMVDQFVDMDAFAAQVAALDAVITISGTTAHVAGALGTPTVVLRDDWFRRQWPVLSDRVPWYPNLRVAGKDGREWGPAFDDAWTKVRSLMADRPQPL